MPAAITMLRDMIARMLVRGTVTAADDTGTGHQKVQARGLVGEVLEDLQHVQPMGLAVSPEPGARVALYEVGGARDHTIALLVSDERTRPKVTAPGEVQLHGKGYTAVRCKSNGDVEVEGGSGAARVTVKANGDVTITGGVVSITGSAVTVGSATTIDGKPFLTHTHAKPTGCAGSTGTGPVA